MILHLRHLLYDKGWKKSVTSGVPSLCVGNLALGGTGKTPFTEYLLKFLTADESRYGKVAVLSRGYGRKSKGFRIVDANDSAADCGDEPLQIKKKFPDVIVAVDADRAEGISRLKEDAVNLVLLDDAFQHRRLIPTGSILLTTCDRPYCDDRIFPFGHLRDLKKRAEAADMIVVSKCPSPPEENEKKEWAKRLGLSDFDTASCTGISKSGKRQVLAFAVLRYDNPLPVFPEGDVHYVHSSSAIIFSGIADDSQFARHICGQYAVRKRFTFPDHHFYSARNLEQLHRCALANPTSILITTEKDARRLASPGMKSNAGPTVPEDVKRRLFHIPVRMELSCGNEEAVLTRFLESLCISPTF